MMDSKLSKSKQDVQADSKGLVFVVPVFFIVSLSMAFVTQAVSDGTPEFTRNSFCFCRSVQLSIFCRKVLKF
jgi:hypothetical protein